MPFYAKVSAAYGDKVHLALVETKTQHLRSNPLETICGRPSTGPNEGFSVEVTCAFCLRREIERPLERVSPDRYSRPWLSLIRKSVGKIQK